MRLKLLLATGFVVAVISAAPVHAQTSYTLYEMLEPALDFPKNVAGVQINYAKVRPAQDFP